MEGEAGRVWRNTGYERFRFKRKAATQNYYISKAVRNDNKFVIRICFRCQRSIAAESISKFLKKKLFRGTFIIAAVMDKSKTRLRKDGQSPLDIN